MNEALKYPCGYCGELVHGDYVDDGRYDFPLHRQCWEFLQEDED